MPVMWFFFHWFIAISLFLFAAFTRLSLEEWGCREFIFGYYVCAAGISTLSAVLFNGGPSQIKTAVAVGLLSFAIGHLDALYFLKYKEKWHPKFTMIASVLAIIVIVIMDNI